MIAYLTGKLLHSQDNFVVIINNGIGYKVFVSSFTLAKVVHVPENIELHIYTHVREDVLALFGFLNREELAMFELLIGVSGVGPKAALSILSIADTKTIRLAVLNKDVSILTRVSGIGKKTAQRVVLELTNKVEALPDGDEQGILVDNEIVEAIVAMGYSLVEAREVVKKLPVDSFDIGAKIKEALKLLGQKRR